MSFCVETDHIGDRVKIKTALLCTLPGLSDIWEGMDSTFMTSNTVSNTTELTSISDGGGAQTDGGGAHIQSYNYNHRMHKDSAPPTYK